MPDNGDQALADLVEAFEASDRSSRDASSKASAAWRILASAIALRQQNPIGQAFTAASDAIEWLEKHGKKHFSADDVNVLATYCYRFRGELGEIFVRSAQHQHARR